MDGRKSSKEMPYPKTRDASYETWKIDRWVIHSSLRNGAREQNGEARIVQPAGVSVERGEEKRRPLLPDDRTVRQIYLRKRYRAGTVVRTR